MDLVLRRLWDFTPFAGGVKQLLIVLKKLWIPVCLHKSLSTSAQSSLGHPPPFQGFSGTSLHIPHILSQFTSTQSTVAYSSSTSVSQGYSQHATKLFETLISVPESLSISITEQDSVEPLLTHWAAPRYSSSAPGVCKNFYNYWMTCCF